MRLNVGVFRAEQFLGAFHCQILDHVDVFAAAVISLARITFGVFVGQHGAERLQYGFGCVIFRSYKLKVILLAQYFALHRLVKFRIVNLKFVIHADSHGLSGFVLSRLNL